MPLKPKVKDTHLQIRINGQLKARFQDLCRRNNTDVSTFLNGVIERIVREDELLALVYHDAHRSPVKHASEEERRT